MLEKFRTEIFKNRFVVLAIFISGTLTIIALIIAMPAKPRHAPSVSNATDRLIQVAQVRLNKDQKNPKRQVALCQLYLQKIRETAQNGLYSKCTELLDTANSIEPNNSEVIATQASVSYGKHSFKEGLTYIEKAIQINSKLAIYYGLKVMVRSNLASMIKLSNHFRKW